MKPKLEQVEEYLDGRLAALPGCTPRYQKLPRISDLMAAGDMYITLHSSDGQALAHIPIDGVTLQQAAAHGGDTLTINIDFTIT